MERHGPAARRQSRHFNDFDSFGVISSTEELKRQRQKRGYCMTCPLNPVKLFEIKKNKWNPLKEPTKEPVTVPGRCHKGVCLVCYPERDPNSFNFSRAAIHSQAMPGSNSQTFHLSKGELTSPEMPGTGMSQRNDKKKKKGSIKSLDMSHLHLSPGSQGQLLKNDPGRLSKSDHDNSNGLRARRLGGQPPNHISGGQDHRSMPAAAGRNVNFHQSQQEFHFQPTPQPPINEESPGITSKTEKTTPPDSPPRDVLKPPPGVLGPPRNALGPPRDELRALPPGFQSSTIDVTQDFDDDMSAITTPSIMAEYTRRSSKEFKVRQQHMQNQSGLSGSLPRGRCADEDPFHAVPKRYSNEGRAATTTKNVDNEIAWRPTPKEPNLGSDDDNLENIYVGVGAAAADTTSFKRNVKASQVHFNDDDALEIKQPGIAAASSADSGNSPLKSSSKKDSKYADRLDYARSLGKLTASTSNNLDTENAVNGAKIGGNFEKSFHVIDGGFDDEIKDDAGQQFNSFDMGDEEDRKEKNLEEPILYQSTNTTATYRNGSLGSTGSNGSGGRIRQPRTGSMGLGYVESESSGGRIRQRRTGSMGLGSVGSENSGGRVRQRRNGSMGLGSVDSESSGGRRSRNTSYADRLEFARDMGKKTSFNMDRQKTNNTNECDVPFNSNTQSHNLREPEEPAEPSNQEPLAHSSFNDEMSNSRKGIQQASDHIVEHESVRVTQLAAATAAKPAPDGVDLNELKSLVNDMMPSAKDCVEIVLGILLESMRSHKHNEEIQEYGLQQMLLLAKADNGNDGNQRAILDLNIHKVAMEAMENHKSHPSILKESCEFLWTLALADSCRAEVIQAGATASILKVVEEQPQEETVVRMAIGALRSLSADSKTKYHLKIKPVAKAMKIQKLNTDIQRDGCAYLSNAAVDTDNETVAVVPHEVMEVVVDALTIHWRRNNEVAESASFCLKNYTFEEANIRALALFRKLPKILEDVGVRGVGDALDVAESIRLQSQLDGSLEDIVLPSMVEAGTGHKAVDNVTDLMVEYDWSLRLTSCALECLGNLVQQSPADRHDIVSKGALKKVMEAMDRFIVDEDLQMKSFGIIQVLAQESEFSSYLRRFHIASYIERSLSVHKNNNELQQIGRVTLNYIS